RNRSLPKTADHPDTTLGRDHAWPEPHQVHQGDARHQDRPGDPGTTALTTPEHVQEQEDGDRDPHTGQDPGRRGVVGDRSLRAPSTRHRPTAHFNWAKPGLMMPLINAKRSSKGKNADFIALTVNHCRSSQS